MGLIEDDHFDELLCLELLRRTRFGRIAMSLAAVPVVYPVRFTLLDKDVVLALPVDQMAKAIDGTVAALQADGFDEDRGRRWTALAIGLVSRIERAEDLMGEQVDSAPLDPTELFPPGSSWDEGHIFRLRPQILSGRWIEAL